MAKRTKVTRRTGTRISGDGNQDWRTPPELVEAVVRLFGPIDFDLAAATSDDAIAQHFFAPEDDALKQSWTGIGRNLWLNPPFDFVGDPQEPGGKCFAQKCWEEAEHLEPDQRIILLVRASVGSNWFCQWVHNSAEIITLNGRVKFVGAKHPMNADLVLAVFHPKRRSVGFRTWSWKDPAAVPR